MNEKYIALAVLIVSVLILIILMIRFFYLKRKKPDIGRIYKTTDGFLANNPANKKSRKYRIFLHFVPVSFQKRYQKRYQN